MPKAVVWDFGNVIVRWDPRTLVSKLFPDPGECDRFLNDVCTLEWHAAHDRGVSFAENRLALLDAHPHHAAAIHAWEARYAEMFSGAIAETEAAIEALHARGVPQYGLSNISTETLAMTMAISPAFGRLKDVIASAAVGLMKPDPAIYRLACERFGYAPADLLFVDDGLHNVEGARAVGLDAHHFTDPAGLWPALEARGLL